MSNAEYTKIVLSNISNFIKPLGYKKKGKLFEKENDDLIYLIGLQKSVSSSYQEVRVTINLAIWIKLLISIKTGKLGKPNVWNAHWRKRLGNLTTSPSDNDGTLKVRQKHKKRQQKFASF